jgi:hypothetical protein
MCAWYQLLRCTRHRGFENLIVNQVFADGDNLTWPGGTAAG